jgi:hypothetical protein
MTFSETNADGQKETRDYSVEGDNAVLTSFETYSRDVEIPSEITGLDGKTRTVTEIGEGAFEGQSLHSVVIPLSITKIGRNTFKDTGLVIIRILGKIRNGMFEKDSLAGCGQTRDRNSRDGIIQRDKNGKGLTIYVQSKKDKKVLSKQMKKAGG